VKSTKSTDLNKLLEHIYISKEELLWWSLQCPSTWSDALASQRNTSKEICPDCLHSGFWHENFILNTDTIEGGPLHPIREYKQTYDTWECSFCHSKTNKPKKVTRRSPRSKSNRDVDSLALCGPMKVKGDHFADPEEIGNTLIEYIDERMRMGR